MADQVTIDKLVATFIKIRTAKEELAREYEAKEKALEEQMATLKNALLDHCKETGVESARTPYGTFFRQTKTRYWTSDWESMHRFMLEHGALDLLERRLHQGNMKQFLADNPDTAPPGLNTDTEYTITIQKPRNK